MNIIVAADKNWGIGRNNELLVSIPVITMLVLFLRGSPFGKDSSVFLPITTTFPVVS